MVRARLWASAFSILHNCSTGSTSAASRLALPSCEVLEVTRPGDANPQGFTFSSCAMPECLDALTGAGDGLAPPARGWRRGVGYAGIEPGSRHCFLRS